MMSKQAAGERSNRKWFNYLVIAAITLIPFLYSFFYLKAYWNPYDHMEDIPVAIVNEDAGLDGVNKGDDLVKALKDKGVLGISEVDAEQAKNGTLDKTYYATITIPQDFTSNLMSATSTDKAPARIVYAPNQKSNYLASQIISRVVTEVELSVNSEVADQIVAQLSNKLQSTPDQIEQVESGLYQISDGSATVNDGAQQLRDGTVALANKYNDFNKGVQTVSNGATDVYNGAAKLDSGIATLQAGAKQLNQATSKLSTLQTGVASLQQNETKFAAAVEGYVTLTKALSDNPALANLTGEQVCSADSPTHNAALCGLINQLTGNNGAKLQISAIANSLAQQIVTANQQIKAGTDSLNSGAEQLSQLTSGIDSLSKGLNGLKTGSTDLTKGAKSLASGAKTLQQSSLLVQTGINTLNNGTNQLANGTNQLHFGVNQAKNKVSDSLTNTKGELTKLNGLNKFAANPVNIEETDINPVDAYGIAFSPFFISIALWVGSLMMFIILYYDANDRFKLFSRNADNRVKRTLGYLGLASLQGVVLGVLLKIGLGLNVTNYLLYFMSMILVACTFESIIEFLIVHFDDIGKFIALILLVLQLAATGGTFPIQTVSTEFQWLYSFLPMTYTIDLFKESLITVDGHLLSTSIMVVLIVFGVFLTMNLISAKRTKAQSNCN